MSADRSSSGSSGASPGTGDAQAKAVRVVLTTAPDEAVARRLARALVEARLVGCVNVLPGVLSVYRWQGAIEETAEVLMIAKTTAACVPALQQRLVESHPYDVPECIVLAPAEVERTYLAWLVAQCEPVGRSPAP